MNDLVKASIETRKNATQPLRRKATQEVFDKARDIRRMYN